MPREIASTDGEAQQAGQQKQGERSRAHQTPTWASSAALCDRIVDMQMRDERIYLRGQRYRFELDVLAFALHGPMEKNDLPKLSEPRAKLKQREVAPMKFDELIFVGDSNKCVSQALAVQLAQKSWYMARDNVNIVNVLPNNVWRVWDIKQKPQRDRPLKT